MKDFEDVKPKVLSSENDKRFHNTIKNVLRYIGENPDREGLKHTPRRVQRMFKEIFKGYNPSLKPKITVFNNNNDGMKYDEMIIDTGKFYTFCEHHMLSVSGEYIFGYIPNEKIMGLSKVARIVDYYSSKLQVQERLVKEILDEIESKVKPLGIAMMMRATHLCKEMRGIKNHGKMITSDMRGVFRTNSDARNEFLMLARNKNE